MITLFILISKEEIYSRVEMMRGKVSKIFTEKVTHLITTEVGSAKYHVYLFKFKDLKFCSFNLYNSYLFCLFIKKGCSANENTNNVARVGYKHLGSFRN